MPSYNKQLRALWDRLRNGDAPNHKWVHDLIRERASEGGSVYQPELYPLYLQSHMSEKSPPPNVVIDTCRVLADHGGLNRQRAPEGGTVCPT